jgi:uncharacterized membrane protein YbaN (DUF454 family)
VCLHCIVYDIWLVYDNPQGVNVTKRNNILDTRLKKIVFITLGSISLVLGTLGIFLPILPTTPFYLLTAWLYLRSSPKLYGKVMGNKYFGKIVRDFQVDKAISLRAKIIMVSMLWVSISLSAFLAVSVWWVRFLLFAVAIGVTIHILSFRTKRKSKGVENYQSDETDTRKLDK